MTRHIRIYSSTICYLPAQQSDELISNIILEKPANKSDFPRVTIDLIATSLRYDAKDYKNVTCAICDLHSDIVSITDIKSVIVGPGTSTDYERLERQQIMNAWNVNRL